MTEQISTFVKDASKAIKLAVAEALAEHKRLGHDIYMWKNRKIVRIPASRIPVPARRHRKAA